MSGPAVVDVCAVAVGKATLVCHTRMRKMAVLFGTMRVFQIAKWTVYYRKMKVKLGVLLQCLHNSRWSR